MDLSIQARVEKRVDGVEAHLLSGKENVSGTAISKIG